MPLAPALLLASLAAVAQGIAALDPRDLLPTGAAAAPWVAVDEPARYGPERLSAFIDGAADLYLGYGFTEAVTQEYQHGDDTVACTLYEMKDAEAAFGVFSVRLAPDTERPPIGDGAIAAGFQLAFWQDRYYVTVDRFATSSETDETLETFARAISSAIGRHAGALPILDRLPRGARVAGSERLLRGRPALDLVYALAGVDTPELGEAESTLTAIYERPDGSVTLSILIFRDAARTSAGWTRLGRLLDAAPGYRPLERRTRERAWVKDERYLVARAGTDWLAIAASAATPDAARGVLERVR